MLLWSECAGGGKANVQRKGCVYGEYGCVTLLRMAGSVHTSVRCYDASKIQNSVASGTFKRLCQRLLRVKYHNDEEGEDSGAAGGAGWLDDMWRWDAHGASVSCVGLDHKHYESILCCRRFYSRYRSRIFTFSMCPYDPPPCSFVVRTRRMMMNTRTRMPRCPSTMTSPYTQT